jgi:hypothetical protein
MSRNGCGGGSLDKIIQIPEGLERLQPSGTDRPNARNRLETSSDRSAVLIDGVGGS